MATKVHYKFLLLLQLRRNDITKETAAREKAFLHMKVSVEENAEMKFLTLFSSEVTNNKMSTMCHVYSDLETAGDL